MGDANHRGKLSSMQVPGTSDRRTQHSGDVEKLKSQVRSCVMQILTERLNKPADFSKMKNAQVTEMIIEYLQWMGYNRTLETFQMECCLSEEKSTANDSSQHTLSTDETVLPKIFEVVNMFKET